MFEDDVAGGIDDEGGVVEVARNGVVFAAGDEVALVFAAPIADLWRDFAVEGVFGEDEELGVWILGDEAIEVFGDFEGGREFELDAGDIKKGTDGGVRMRNGGRFANSVVRARVIESR